MFKEVYRLLVAELRPYSRAVVLACLASLVAAAFGTIGPIAMGRGFDAAGKHQGALTLLAWVGLWAALSLGADLIRSRLANTGGLIASEIAHNYSMRAALKLVRKTLSFHYEKKSQEGADALQELRWQLDNIVNGLVFDIIPSIVALVSILGYVAWLDWRIALCLGVSAGAMGWYSVYVGDKTIKLHETWMKARRKASGAAWDAIRNILVVKSTANEDHVTERIERYTAEFQPHLKTGHAHDRLVRDVQSAIILGGTSVSVLLALLAVDAGRFTAGQATTIMAYTFAVFGYIRYFQWQARNYLNFVTSLKAMNELLASPDEDYASGAERVLSGGVEFKNVAFAYRADKPVLTDVSFAVRAGQRVAIVGESGEGKTTLVDLIGKYFSPTHGVMRFDDLDASTLNLRALRRQMALVPQDLTLFNETIEYNIRYGRPDASVEDVHRAARQADLYDFIESLPEKWETKVGERGLKLSGGERQRVALARAFLRDPRILILDEPTSNLDSVTEGRIQAALEELMKGRTTFVIAHRLRTVRHADLILVLKDGVIAESGTHSELVRKNGAYVALLRAQGMIETELGDAPSNQKIA